MNRSLRCCLALLAVGVLLLVGGGSGGCGSQANTANEGNGGGDVLGGGEDSNGNGIGDAVEAINNLCGNGTLDPGEECDDGNVADGDGCSAGCLSVSPTCGDGAVNDPTEVCDDGNAIDDDDCNNSCRPATIVQVAVGGAHTCVLTSGGRVRCWGVNEAGELGYGHKQTIGDDETPYASALSGLGGDVDVGGKVIQIAAGQAHTCALLETGNVRCWGEGSNGRLGYGNTNDIGDDPGETPASVGDVPVGGLVAQISTGDAHTCALMQTGHVRCWGKAQSGRLGYTGHILQAGGVNLPQDLGDEPSETPDLVGDADVGGDIVQISAGGSHTCALYHTGKVRCWGEGSAGQLGYADTLASNSPFLQLGEDLGDAFNEMTSFIAATDSFVPVGFSALQIATGGNHSCATSSSSTVRCWGDGGGGRLGYGNVNNIGDNAGETPAATGDILLGLSASTPITQIELGSVHTCLRIAANNGVGLVQCWGIGANGRLGYGNEDNVGDNEIPPQAGFVSVGSSVVQISAGQGHTCAVLDNGYVRCWGINSNGQLGYGNTQGVGDTAASTPNKVGNVNIIGFQCGNGNLQPGEGCDDGNHLGGDGCSAGCLVE